MTAHNTIFQAISQVLESLPPEKQQEVLNFAEFLQHQSSQPQFIQSKKTTDWLPGFFEEVIGGWVGEALERTE